VKELTEETETVIGSLNRIITDQVGKLNQILASTPRISASLIR
jgi:hypothetical protein